MRFRTWIASNGGPKGVSQLLKINKYTVYAWLNRGITPHANHMIKLIHLGKGAFDFADIVHETKRTGAPR